MMDLDTRFATVIGALTQAWIAHHAGDVAKAYEHVKKAKDGVTIAEAQLAQKVFVEGK